METIFENSMFMVTADNGTLYQWDKESQNIIYECKDVPINRLLLCKDGDFKVLKEELQ